MCQELMLSGRLIKVRDIEVGEEASLEGCS